MIRSSKTTLKFANRGKRDDLNRLIDEYRDLVSRFVDIVWNLPDIKPLLEKDITSQVSTWLSARMVQCAGKQASAIARGSKQKQKQRLFVIEKLAREGDTKGAERLRKIYEAATVSKPDIGTVEMELDSRFVSIDLENPTAFDGWVCLSSIGGGMKLQIPFKKTKHFNKLLSKGLLKTGIRVSKKSATFMFEIPEPAPRTEGSVLGIDIGKTNMLACSNGFMSTPDIHGHDLNSILASLGRKCKGSKGFRKAQTHRENHVNWSVNQLNLDGVCRVNIENMKHLRKFKTSSRTMGHWAYADIFGKLESRCSEQGVPVRKVAPAYTSQRCPECGWVRKGNRKGKLFRCTSCGHAADADLNASLNISLDLRPVGAKERLLQKNRTGFYLHEVGWEPIVPDTRKTTGSMKD